LLTFGAKSFVIQKFKDLDTQNSNFACGFFYGSLTLREESMLRLFENRLLRRIFGPKRDEETREWRKLHNEELNDLYFSNNIFRLITWRRMR